MAALVLGSIGCHAINSRVDSALSGDSVSVLSAEKPSLFRSRQLTQRQVCIETADKIVQNGHPEEAITLYERAESLEPGSPKLDRQLASLYASVGKHNQAIERYRRLVQQNGKDAQLANNLAWTLMEASRLSEAVTEAQRALKIHPDDSRLVSTLAVIHHRQGNTQAAFDAFSKQYGAAIAHHNVAILDIEAGDAVSARSHVAKAVDLGAGNETTRLLAALDKHSSDVKRR